jgi:hypothetical protein
MLTGHPIAYNPTKYDWYTAAKGNAYQIPFDYFGATLLLGPRLVDDWYSTVIAYC